MAITLIALVAKKPFSGYKADEVFSLEESVARKALEKFPNDVRLFDKSKDADLLLPHTPGTSQKAEVASVGEIAKEQKPEAEKQG